MTRVIQWATGVTGTMALRHVIGRPDLELVGVRVYDPAKAGMMPARSVGYLIPASLRPMTAMR